MVVRARAFNIEKDYDMIFTWWRAHGSFPPKREQLPSTGVVVEVNDKPVSAGFLYQTDSTICVFEFVVCDPKAGKGERDLSLTKLITSIQNLANAMGYNLIYSSVKHKKYISRLDEEGFIKADENQVHMFYEVKEDD